MQKNRAEENGSDTESLSEEFVVFCGGIKPFIHPEQNEETQTAADFRCR